MPKFDVVVGNPPYQRSLHLKFLELAYKISDQWILWVQPSNWLIDEKGKTRQYKKSKDLINNNVKNITLFNGNRIFNVGLFNSFMISVIDKKNENGGKIIVKDKISGKVETYHNINDINKWNDIKIYPGLKNKFVYLCKKDNLDNHLRKDEGGKYYINMTDIRGHISYDPEKILDDDFYSMVPKDEKITSGPTKWLWWNFKSKKEAENCLKFLKTRWAMFGLSIFKTNQHIDSGKASRLVPWLDWNQEWTEEKFENLIDATPEEIEFVYNNIPDYYNISK